MFHSITSPIALPATTLASRVGSRLVQLLRLASATALEWQRRARERQQLASMDARMRRDLGLSNVDLWCEVNKPFWRA